MKLTNLPCKKMLSIVTKKSSNLAKCEKEERSTSSNNTKQGHNNNVKTRNSNIKGNITMV
jgi:hypothetical protein